MVRLVKRDAAAVIFRRTEATMLVGPDDATVPLFDITMIHAQAAVTAALGEPGVAG